MPNKSSEQFETGELVSPSQTGISRRDILVGLLASVGAVVTTSCVDNLEKAVSSNTDEKASKSLHLSFYSDNEYALVASLADLIIPDTETIGALAVGVPLFMDRLYNEWAATESKSAHKQDLARVQQALDAISKQNYLALTPDEQTASLSELDQQAFSNKTAVAASYRSIKSLIARFYYSSEVGASQELRYELVPGRWEPCVPFEKIGRTWAA